MSEELKIIINKVHYPAPAPVMTGREIKALASIPAGNKLFKEMPGKQPDQVIGDDQRVELEKNEKFYDLPPGTVGGGGSTAASAPARARHPLLERQLERLLEQYPWATIAERGDGSMAIAVTAVLLPVGWNRSDITITLNLPPGYPTAKPNGFECDHDVRLAGGGNPSGRSELSLDGTSYSHFCWHPSQQWENDDNELWKRIKFALMRFETRQ